MRIAVVGAGIAGLSAAARLHPAHSVTVFEADDWVGGHTHTVEVDDGGRAVAVDTGFIVYNEWTYPAFTALLAELGVASQPSAMSFSLADERTGLEYNGTTLNTLFAQRRNLANPSFLGMLADILRFNGDAKRALGGTRCAGTLAEFLAERRYGRAFVERYIVPMGRAIWSAEQDALLGFPARFFLDFFERHGFLSINDRPRWRAVTGGSRAYVAALTAPFADRIRTRTPVQAIVRDERGVSVVTDGASERFDAVVLACHSDQALRLLESPSAHERQILGAIRYQPNDVVLHTDLRVLPRRRLAQAAWNYRLCAPVRPHCTLTYDMNVLQDLDARRRYLVSLNLTDRLAPGSILGRWSYAHPVYTPDAVAAQERHPQISGVRRTFYAGAYWRFGFHEDGLVSGLKAAAQVAEWAERAQRAV